MSEIIIELGCGKTDKKEGVIGIDISKHSNADMIFDLNEGIPFDDDTVDKVYAIHFLEHMDFDFMMKEIYRVLKIGGIAEIEMPYFTSSDAYFPLHIIPGVSWLGMQYYIEQGDYYSGVRFEMIENRIINRFGWLEWLINKIPRFYDVFLSHIIPSMALKVKIRKVSQ